MTRTSSGAPSNGSSRPRAKSFANHAAALRWLNARTNVERTRPHQIDPAAFKLERMQALLAELGDPHADTKFVHIAGSKGKGSVAEMVVSCLTACSYGVGLLTSPHLVDIRERIRIGNAEISEGDFTRLLAKAATANARMIAKPAHKKLGEATYFELLAAVAFLYFAEQAVDLAVIEVGLGGRLDATNVITPEVTAVTAIQLEHTELLGDTLPEIAREKAGIFKPDVKALTFKQPGEVLDALKAAAQDAGAVFKVVGKDIDFSYRFEASPELGPHARVVLSTRTSNFEHLPAPLKGEHQALNCGLALA
ncbi:MAG: Mur ligase family protein, partial [Planctomycetota bacterium]